MFGINSTDYDKFIYEEYLRDFLPDRMIDIHVHIWKEGMEREGSESRKGMVDWTKLVAPDCSIEDLMRSYEQRFPGKSVKPVLMAGRAADLQKTTLTRFPAPRNISFRFSTALTGTPTPRKFGAR